MLKNKKIDTNNNLILPYSIVFTIEINSSVLIMTNKLFFGIKIISKYYNQIKINTYQA